MSAPDDDDTDDDRNIYQNKCDDNIAVKCIMLAFMESELVTHFKNYGAYDIIVDMKALFQQ